jgi:hypothetical protein
LPLPRDSVKGPTTLSRWRHGFESRWDYDQNSLGIGSARRLPASSEFPDLAPGPPSFGAQPLTSALA